MKKKVLLIVIIAMIAFIWGQSLLSQADSSKESSIVLNIVRPLLEFFYGPGKVTNNLVRKIAHFTEFAALGLALSFLFKNRRYGIMYVFGIAFLAAFLDETIQIFSGRGSMIKDVWLDLFGAACSAAVFFLIRFLIGRHRSHKAL